MENANRYLIVVDMQNDFVTGSLGSPEAEEIVDNVVNKIKTFEGNVIATLDTHETDYLSTQEGRLLPVEHCIRDTEGRNLVDDIAALKSEIDIREYTKPTFGSVELAKELSLSHEKSPIEKIELIGLCTDICVVSNALLLKAFMPEVEIAVDPSCCAGVTKEKHEAALKVMESCQIIVK